MIARLLAFLKRLFAKKSKPLPVLPAYQLDWAEEFDWPDIEARMFER